MTTDPIKVAILGGGPASLSTAYYLTSLEPGKYDITVYEMSWRLGGKTASGRDENGRIEEHGLHVLFGGYHNAFDMMLGAYDAVRRECGPDTLAFPSFFDALEPGDFGVIGDDRYDTWRQVNLQFPVNRGVPGDPPLPTTWDLLSGAFQVMLHVVLGARTLRFFQRLWGRLAGYRRRFPRTGRRRARQTPGDGGDWVVRKVVIGGALALLDGERGVGWAATRAVRAAHWLVRAVGPAARLRFVRDTFVGRVWTFLDLVLATCKGLSADRVLFTPDGYRKLDAMDLRVWLKRHGTHWHTRYSPLVRIIYDAAFSYPEGGRRVDRRGFMSERMAAGAALRIIIWMAFTYKGAMYFKMRAGMGDVISTPLYRLLKKRGVKFKFFHKVKALRAGVDADGRAIVKAVELVELARPAGDGDYDPLVRVGDLDCWPSKPILDRVHADDHADALRAEEFFHEPESPRRVTLVCRQARVSASSGPIVATGGAAGTFDKIVFGIPVGCVPYLCGDLEGKGNWGEQRHVASTQTVAFQLWSRYSLADLGWKDPPPLLSLFWDPLNTWSDMSQVLPQEGWPEGERPAMLAYFCGPLPHLWPGPETSRLDPERDAAWRAGVDAQARDARERLLERLRELWPKAGAPGAFNCSTVHDPANRKGRARLEAQYLRANFDPHARCTLALPGKSECRIHADDTGYANLTVAGDWTANDVLVACFEGTVQSGIRAARAVSDQKLLYRIIGEDLLNPGATFAHRPSRSRKIVPPRPPRPPRGQPPTPRRPAPRPQPRLESGEIQIATVSLTPPPELLRPKE
jgi:uncharacterized protein with NAD-binding domain and iron-sulfur cluster